MNDLLLSKAHASGNTATTMRTRPTRDKALLVERFDPGQAGRAELEDYIASTFRAAYGAEVTHFCDVLLGSRDAQGNWVAALGYTLAARKTTFLEQYLDLPLEAAVSAQVRGTVGRSELVEVGNLAAAHPGAARTLIVAATRLLHGLGLHWVVFTATVSLLNSFTRLRLQPQVLAPADPARLSGPANCWGTYYDTQPKVMFGDIRYGYDQLN